MMNRTLNTANVMAQPRAKRSMGKSVTTLREVPSLSKDDKSFFTAISTSERFTVAFAQKLFLGEAKKA